MFENVTLSYRVLKTKIMRRYRVWGINHSLSLTFPHHTFCVT